MLRKASTQIRLLQIGTALLLLGRAWEHLFWRGKLLYKVYDESFIDWFMATFLNREWKGFLINNQINPAFVQTTHIIGICLLILTIYVLFIHRIPKRFHYFLFLIPLYYLPVFISQLAANSALINAPIELMIQFGMPIALFFSLDDRISIFRLQFFMKVVIAATFFSHGVFAIYLLPIPESFITMTRNIMDISTVDAIRFLKVVGWIDIICALLIFIPQVDILVTGYIIIWGIMTAVARFFGTAYYGDWFYHMNRWTPEFLIRICHFLLPLVLLQILLKIYAEKIKINRIR